MTDNILTEISNFIVLRNATETTPFLSIHDCNSTLLNLVDDLQRKCDDLESDNVGKKITIQRVSKFYDIYVHMYVYITNPNVL